MPETCSLARCAAISTARSRGSTSSSFLRSASAPRDFEQVLELRVPGFDAVFEIHRQNADPQRFDDIFAEILQPLDLQRLLFER